MANWRRGDWSLPLRQTDPKSCDDRVVTSVGKALLLAVVEEAP